MTNALHTALGRLGMSEFRPGQREVIESVLAGRPTVAVMPTGAGKSLCYQLPSLMLDGVTLVVSPLISLMKDQVDQLASRGVRAMSVTSADGADERAERLEALASGREKLVFVAPERFRSPRFLEALSRVKVALFAIDEAHCISHWGHDFRPEYLQLGEVRARLKPERLVALTATATQQVRTEMVERLGLARPVVFVRGFDRPNLRFVVERAGGGAEKIARTVELVREHKGGAAIVYAATRKNAEATAVGLHKKGLRALAYHAGLADERRAKVHDAFTAGELDAVVATNAFGMGIDKADVRLVVHIDMPRSLEAYYQEAGRAGRDGAPASAVLLFNPGDVRLQEYLIDGTHPSAWVLRAVWRALSGEPRLGRDEEALANALGGGGKVPTIQAGAAMRILEREGLLERDPDGELRALSPRRETPFDPESVAARAEIERQKLRAMTAYGYAPGCRRRHILVHFGDPAADEMESRGTCCDTCDRRASARPPTEEERFQARAALSALESARGRFGRMKIALALAGSAGEELERTGLTRMPEYRTLAALGKDGALRILDALEGAGLARATPGEYPTMEITPEGRAALAGTLALEDAGFVAPGPAARKQKARKVKARAGSVSGAGSSSVSSAGPGFDARLARLREVRTALARRDSVPAYVVCTNATLEAIAARAPASKAALLDVPGIGPARAERYGAELLAALVEATQRV